MSAKAKAKTKAEKPTLKSRARVGFDRPIRREWLNQALEIAFRYPDISQARKELLKPLSEEIKGKEAQQKTLGILSTIWFKPPKPLISLRDDAINIYSALKDQSSNGVEANSCLAFHWGMAMAVYPFFRAIAEIVGRLLRLQGYISQAQVQRRVQEQFGESKTVIRAVQRIVRSFVEWNVLQETKEKGIYKLNLSWDIRDKRLTLWLIEATLIASDYDSTSLRNISHFPSLFPFTIVTLNERELDSSKRIEFFRQGLDEEMIMLRKLTY